VAWQNLEALLLMACEYEPIEYSCAMVRDGSEAGPTKAFRDAAAAAAIRIGILNFSRKPNSKTQLVLEG
jgi:hypothetical protein